MSKNSNKKYYSPTEYEKYRNASKASGGRENSENAYTIHDDEYFYNQLQAENNRHRQRENGGKPEQPKPPVNLKPKEEKHYSVYDEIAARHKRERSANNGNTLTPLKPITPVVPDITETNMPKKHKSVQNTKSVEKKIFNQDPVTEKETEDFISKVAEIADFDEENSEKQYYSQAEIEEICRYYKRKYSRKMWIVLIISLVIFCGLIGVMYLYTGGYLDGFISAL